MLDAEEVLQLLIAAHDSNPYSKDSVYLQNTITQLKKELSEGSRAGADLDTSSQEIDKISSDIENLKSRRFVFGKDKKLAKLESSLQFYQAAPEKSRLRSKTAYLKISQLSNIGTGIIQNYKI